MPDITNQLQDNRQPTLLLYLASELSAQDRADLEQILTSDPALRADLESLTALQDEVVGGLQRLDEASPLTMSEELSTRRVLRDMRKLQLELNTRAPVYLLTHTHRAWPRWSYPLAAAAAIIFIVLGLWGVGAIDFSPSLPGPGNSGIARQPDGDSPLYAEVAQERLSDILFASFGPDELDHPIELEETEDPAAFRTNG